MFVMHHFFAYLYRLRYISRWSLMRNSVHENVAEHSYYVAVIAHTLATIDRDVYGVHTDPERSAVRALFHDATEAFTGDIPTPVKHHNDALLQNFRAIERIAATRLHTLVPAHIRPAYAQLIGVDDADPYVKAADVLDAYLKCVTERTNGNREFVHAEAQTLQSLHALDMPAVSYFLTHLAPSVHKSLDELQTP
jgi:5'-deoxynucleotidase